jgi:tetratricopeptide (TPR) repeat protein
MKEKYLASIKKSLLSSSNAKEVFYRLVQNFDIKGLKKLPDFNQLKDSIMSLKISPQEIFEKLAIIAVKKKNLGTLKFLLDECGYDLSKTVDVQGITLLHEACLYGENEIVEYLLKKGFDPNAKDGDGETPLLRVVAQREANTSLIPLLKKYNVNLNLKDKNELTPLFVAILFNPDSQAALELIKQGANTNYKHYGLSYSQFKQEVKKGNIENESPEVNLSPPIESISEQAVAKYCKGCLLSDFNEQIFKEVKAVLSRSSETLSKLQFFCLVDALILTSETPFQPQRLITGLLKFVQEGKIPFALALLGILKTSKAFVEQNQIEVVAELNQFALNKLENKEIAAEESVNYYFTLGILYKQIGLFLKSEYCLQQAIQNLSEQSTNKEKMEIWFNLGCTQSFLINDKKALESFKKAYYFDQNDEEAFHEYLYFLLKFKHYKEALEICEKSESSEYSKICTAYVRTLTGDSSWSDLLKIVNVNFAHHRANIMRPKNWTTKIKDFVR